MKFLSFDFVPLNNAMIWIRFKCHSFSSSYFLLFWVFSSFLFFFSSSCSSSMREWVSQNEYFSPLIKQQGECVTQIVLTECELFTLFDTLIRSSSVAWSEWVVMSCCYHTEHNTLRVFLSPLDEFLLPLLSFFLSYFFLPFFSLNSSSLVFLFLLLAL